MSITNAMTIDVEDYFQVSAFESVIDRSDWENIPSRIPDNVEKILLLLERHNTRATFFTLGWIAVSFPQVIADIVKAGHEIACHGWSHVRLSDLTPESFLADISTSRKILQDVSGQEILGYRAPSFSVTSETLWAYEKLSEAGYLYSSSIFPIKHDIYGLPLAPRKPFVIEKTGVHEIPLTTVRMFGRNYPFSGGGWFRLMPYSLFRYGLKKVNNEEGVPGVFYIHPWELDPQQPRQHNVSTKTSFRHYLNLEKTRRRLEHLLQDFRWDTVHSVFLDQKNGYPSLSIQELSGNQKSRK